MSFSNSSHISNYPESEGCRVEGLSGQTTTDQIETVQNKLQLNLI